MATKGNSGKNSRSQGANLGAKSKARRAAGQSSKKSGKAAMSAGRSTSSSSLKSPRHMEASSSRSGVGKGDNKDALDVLKAQHREVESLFKQFDRAENDNESFEVAQLICQKLTVHATIEEETLYPAALNNAREGEGEGDHELKDLVLEAAEEHLSAKRLIADIQAVEVGSETLKAKISVLEEQVSHHVDEEEDELFPKLKKALPKDERRQMGLQLLQRTEELEAEQEVEGAAAEESDRAGASPSMAGSSKDDSEAEQDDESAMGGGSVDEGARKPDAGRSPRSAPHHHH